MFIDSYAVEKYCKAQNIVLMEEHTKILNEIDEKQGLKNVLQLEHADPTYRKSLWAILQKVHPYITVVESDMYYAQSYEYIHVKNIRKEQYAYKVFIVNYKDEKFMENPDLIHLNEKVAAGDKLVIYTVP